MADETSTLHIHDVVDDDPHFIIDGNTREIILTSDTNPILIQKDHDSERFTFEVPRLIDGHDLTKCNHIEVHFSNVDASLVKTTKDGKIDEDDFRLNWKRIISTAIGNVSSSIYDVDDLAPKADDPEKLTFTWLIDGKGAVYAGPLIFSIRFRCTEDVEDKDDDGQWFTKTYDVYRWNTKPYIGVNVSDCLDAEKALDDEYRSIIDKWQDSIDAFGDSAVTKVMAAVTSIITTVDGAKTSAKDEIEQLVSESRKDLAASALDVKEILVQSTGYNDDRVMSQKAVTDQINRLDNVVVGLGTNVEQKIGERYKHMEETFTSLSELISYQQVGDRNGFSTSEFGRTYVFKPLYGYDNAGNAVENPIQIVYETECAFRVAGALADKTLVYYHDNIELNKLHVFDEYRTYQSIRLLGRKTYVEFDPKCYILVTADPNNGEWMDSMGRDAAPGDNRVPYFSELRSGPSGDYSDVERNTYTSTVKPETFSRVNSVANSKCIHAYIGDNGLVEAECTLYQRTGTNGETIYFFFEDDYPRYRIRTTFAYEFNGVRYEQTRSDSIYWEDYSGDAYDYIWGTPEVRGMSSTLCVDRVYPAYVRTFEYDEPHDNMPEFTVAANGISSVTGPIKNGLKDTYTIIFDNGTSRTFDVTNGRAIDTVEYASTNNDEDTYEIRFNDGTKQTFTVPNVEANRAYLEDNIEDIHSTLNKFGATTTEHVSEVTNLIDVPERTTKFAKLNSFGGMTRKVAVPTSQGGNLLPFPYAGNNFGTDGAGTVELNSTYGYSKTIIDETNPWTVPDTGMVEQGYRFMNCSSDGQGVMTLTYIHDGVEVYTGSILNLTYDVVLKPGDIVTQWDFHGENAMGGCELTVQPAISVASFDSETDKWVYYDLEWVPRVAQYRLANTKLQAIKSVDSNDEVVHTYTIPSDIPAVDGFVDVAGNEHVDTVDVSTQICNRKVGVLRCMGTENWKDYVGGTNTRPSGVYVYALNLADKKPGLTNVASTIGEYKPDAYDYGNDGEFCGHRSLSTVYFATSKYKTLPEWKAHVSSLNVSGTPLTLYYELAEPVTEPLPTRLDRLIPVEPNGHLLAVTETNVVISTGDAVPLDVEFTVVNEQRSEHLVRVFLDHCGCVITYYQGESQDAYESVPMEGEITIAFEAVMEVGESFRSRKTLDHNMRDKLFRFGNVTPFEGIVSDFDYLSGTVAYLQSNDDTSSVDSEYEVISVANRLALSDYLYVTLGTFDGERVTARITIDNIMQNADIYLDDERL